MGFRDETDYDKVVNFAHRVNGSTRYRAVILGGCPHKVGSLGANSSLVEKLKQENITPFAIDARNGAGKLKITKQSFRNALTEVYMELRKAV
ncbi:MAG: hypothetical protein E7290_08120 [Lachnospiraceae bacterium]|nr:hypothetical protein [Lachnospiraceae bacterium]